jgi:hypothetical protein
MTDAELLKQVKILQNGLVAFSTGGSFGDANYEGLRKLIIANPRLKVLAPDFLRANRTLDQFWGFIKGEFTHWAERRKFLWDAFTPLIDELEGGSSIPADDHVSDVLSAFDTENVHAVWQKALDRRRDDPEGAITTARTLLETVCKYILDQAAVQYEDDADLPKLYRIVASHLNLSPGQHSEEIFKRILGGCVSIVEGLGTLRNKLSDSHGKGIKRVKPDTRHAELAVNLAGSMATFLIETWEHRQTSI